jgi:quinol monooxygenase YgiN
MSISLIVSALGAVVAAAGSGVLLARCFRAPRGDLIGWSLALLGLLVSLGSQTLGYLSGFDAAMFRAMEIGAQVIAPLALLLALSEVAARSVPVRFCARLYIPALGLVAIVVLLLDQLTDAAFSKSWPDPARYYQIAPKYALYALGGFTFLIAVTAMVTVARRASQPAWNAVLQPQLAGGAAALLLAYPPLALLLANEAAVHLPVGSLFPVLCTAAAGLTWLAGTGTGRVRLAELRGRPAGLPGRDERRGGFDGAGDLEPPAAGGRAMYRDGGDYRRDRAGQDAADGRYPAARDGQDARDGFRDPATFRDRGDMKQDGWDGRAARDWDDDWDRARDQPAGPRDQRQNGDRHQNGYQSGTGTGDFATGDFDAGDYGAAGYGPGADHAAGYGPGADHAAGYGPGADHAAGYGPAGYDAGGHQAGGFGAAGYGADDREAGGYGTGDDTAGDHGAGGYGGDYRAGVPGPGYSPGGWQSGGAAADAGLGRHPAGWPDDRADQAGHGEAPERAQLFGQIAIYTLLEDRVEEFDRLSERVVEQVRSREPDALVFIVHAVPSAPMQRILYEVYRDRAAYQQHVRLPHVMQFETDRRPYVLATNVIELGLQQAKVSPFPSVAELFGEPGYDTSGFQRPDYLRDFGGASAPQSGHRERR